MDALARIFVGIRVPTEFREKIEATKTDIRRKSVSDIRWNSQEELMLTLAAPGEVGMASMNRLVVTIKDACQGAQPMQLSLQGLVGQPNNLQPRYIGLGVAGDVDKLTALHATISKAVTAATGHVDNKPFSTHCCTWTSKRVFLDLLEFFRGQRRRFLQDGVADADLADVMHKSC